jgi:hypothetical protein
VKTVFFFYAFLMWKYYLNNPCGRVVGDCAVRAVSVALGLTWEEAYLKIATAGYGMCDMPSSDSVWGAVLRQNGFERKNIPATCPDCYTAEDFCKDNPKGVYVLGFGGHVATVIDGVIYDAWDSSKEIPQFVWFRRK